MQVTGGLCKSMFSGGEEIETRLKIGKQEALKCICQ